MDEEFQTLQRARDIEQKRGSMLLPLHTKIIYNRVDKIAETQARAFSYKFDLFLKKAQGKQKLIDKCYLTKSEVAELLGVSEKSVDAMRRKAILPEPKKIPLSDNTKGRTLLRWKAKEVMDYIDQY